MGMGGRERRKGEGKREEGEGERAKGKGGRMNFKMICFDGRHGSWESRSYIMSPEGSQGREPLEPNRSRAGEALGIQGIPWEGTLGRPRDPI